MILSQQQQQQVIMTTATPPPDYDVTSPHIVAAVVSTLYQNLLSCTWTADRYYSFFSLVELVVKTAQFKQIEIILNSLIYIKKYLVKMTQQQEYNIYDKNNNTTTINTDENSIFLTAFKLSQKFHADYYFPRYDMDFDIFTQLNSRQLKQFEWEMLDKIEYNLNTTAQDYLSWQSACFYTFIRFVAPPMPRYYYAIIQQQQDLLLLCLSSSASLLPLPQQQSIIPPPYNNDVVLLGHSYYYPSFCQEEQLQQQQQGRNDVLLYCDDMSLLVSPTPPRAIATYCYDNNSSNKSDYHSYYDNNETMTTTTAVTTPATAFTEDNDLQSSCNTTTHYCSMNLYHQQCLLLNKNNETFLF